MLLALLALLALSEGANGTYLVGAGRYDVTGPVAQIQFQGYAKLDQVGHGIHFRLWSRAFIMVAGSKRVAFVNVDISQGTQLVKMQVVKKLRSIYRGLYNNDNVLITGTHSHSVPAGYFQYALYEVTSLGYVKQTLDAIVGGIVKSIQRAHKSLRPGRLYINSGLLWNASIQRSRHAYVMNPSSERARYYSVGGDTDKTMLVLKMTGSNGADLGMIDWFAVHPTSMNNTNVLVSGDNKGYASLLMEKAMNPPGTLPGKGTFVGAFAQSNEGDVSPNIKGAHCQNTGEMCDIGHSPCNGDIELCIATGPGKDMFESTKIIAERQFTLGKQLYDSATRMLSGPVDYRHMFVDFSNVQLKVNGRSVHTCPPAMGAAFAAGTSDGPGGINFEHGSDSLGPFWELVRNIIKKPSNAQVQCHAPKPILIDTASLSFPYAWQPTILPLQLLRVGQLVIIGVPSEFTTMAGRRTREAVKNVLVTHGRSQGFNQDTVVVLAGLSNTYSGYTTTFEEYQEQYYEGASTVYGPYTLDAYISKFRQMAMDMATGRRSKRGPNPPDLLSKQVSLHTPVVYDSVGWFRNFGDVTKNAYSIFRYSVGNTVKVRFRAGNPRNNLMTERTFLTVERKVRGRWRVICNDACWETRFVWYQTSFLLGRSEATVLWTIPKGTPSGSYRIRHYGHYKPLFGSVRSYSGTSRTFYVSG